MYLICITCVVSAAANEGGSAIGALAVPAIASTCLIVVITIALIVGFVWRQRKPSAPTGTARFIAYPD